MLSDADPHRDRWIEYEEGAVERARERNALVQSVTTLANKAVLDVGCQNGAWLVALGQAGANPTGIDVIPEAVQAARIRATAYGLRARTQLASACEMPFRTGEFDIVASSDVLEHVPDKVAMLHECVRVLRPGGVLFLRAPIRFGLKNFAKDPHYGHPGISVFSGGLAARMATKLYGEASYDVETLPTKVWTVRKLRSFGMTIVELDRQFAGRSLPVPDRWNSLLDELRQSFTLVATKTMSR
ncbi:class I SAM-dependent methyltransferase [Dermatobacter hominis]|uniref:class I SAM-dependent methyltransferase n=1 Tax=Dermatobacter hominis TaxID=2884263 RepID=UPI001D109941|nr:class I SAM-dependent methyltransferase [Dermatobacter hominis]UDY37699.1 class I SAM-dependent methyltransferase [Dermatobacter hominis]